MGLGLEVGWLADLASADAEGYDHARSVFEAVNVALRRAGLPEHREPADCDVFSCDMLGYSGLHDLRRLAAHLDATGRLPEAPGAGASSKDPMLQGYYERATPGFWRRLVGRRERGRFDHLILHSDAEGLYLPVDFPDVLFPSGELRIPGGMIGSVPRLAIECALIHSALQIPDDLDERSDALWDAADAPGAGPELWQRYGRESYSCVCLERACAEAVRTGAALVFC
jgi:hypothetical protein